jgi:Transglutaminase-like superfamily
VAASAQIVVAAALRVMPLPSLRASVPRISRFARFFVDAADDRVIWAIEATGRRLGRLSTCLTRALAAEWLLDASGGRVSLTIGVRRSAGSLEAHAWLARDGRILIGGPADEYEALGNWNSPSA